MKNHYQTLGLEKDANEHSIKKAYRLYVNKMHPDKHSGDKFFEQRFKEVLEAYEVLSDPEKKRVYDNEFVRNYSLEEQIQALKSWEHTLKQRENQFVRQQEERQWEIEEKQKLRIVQYIFFGLALMVLLYLLGYAISKSGRVFSKHSSFIETKIKLPENHLLVMQNFQEI